MTQWANSSMEENPVYFCNRFFDKRDRTRDRMIQAAHSGKQNTIEGSQASGTSKETEIKLTNIARASSGAVSRMG